MHHVLQEAAREREIEERERKLGALMAEKGAIQQKKKTSKVCMPSDGTTCINDWGIQLHCSFDMIVRDSPQEASLLQVPRIALWYVHIMQTAVKTKPD